MLYDKTSTKLWLKKMYYEILTMKQLNIYES